MLITTCKKSLLTVINYLYRIIWQTSIKYTKNQFFVLFVNSFVINFKLLVKFNKHHNLISLHSSLFSCRGLTYTLHGLKSHGNHRYFLQTLYPLLNISMGKERHGIRALNSQQVTNRKDMIIWLWWGLEKNSLNI